MKISHSTTSPSFFTNWVKDGIAFSIGLIALKKARTPLFKIERLSLKTLSLAGGMFCLGTSLGRAVIDPFDTLLFSYSSPSHREWINACFKGILLTTAASLPIFALHLVGRLFTLSFFPIISFKEALGLAIIGSGAIMMAQPFRFIHHQASQKPPILPRKPQHLKRSKKVVKDAIKASFHIFQVKDDKPFDPLFVERFIHEFFFYLYATPKNVEPFLNKMAQMPQKCIDNHLETSFEEVLGNLAPIQQHPCKIFFEKMYDTLRCSYSIDPQS